MLIYVKTFETIISTQFIKGYDYTYDSFITDKKQLFTD